MPELPEVETIVQGLKKEISGLVITRVLIREEKLIAFPDLEEFRSEIEGKEILDLSRRGKYILIHLSGAKTLIIHLRMTGRLLLKPREEEYSKHTYVIFYLDNGLDLRFHNVRKFGRLYLVDNEQLDKVGGLAELGPEPLDENFTLKDFQERMHKRKGKIKSLLLNQSFLAGLGNIYADEALFRARISPQRRADSLNDKEIAALYHAVRQVLQEGIKYGGTSFRDYVNSKGEKGGFQNKLLVYQRSGQKCPVCGQEIIKEKLAGRSTHYCPHCQR